MKILSKPGYNQPMTNISLQELAKDPAGLIDRVEAGERVLVVREGRAVAELRPITQPRSASRPYGLASGAFRVPDDFDSPLPDSILQDFEMC
jgi:antitoxin (DNA-binding transcriptional repressor) of toxin-antitoxin stability system